VLARFFAVFASAGNKNGSSTHQVTFYLKKHQVAHLKSKLKSKG
jgi:hypothetical protein